ncbi:MAG: glycosyl transferase [Candidatus Binatia bacterium]|nr:MAG: glycosyl transferase [Candidatus Binatia bacterium]
MVDDGSEDATAELARREADRVVTIPHSGKASAIMTGIREAQGEVVLFTDMDQATPITEAPKLLRAIARGADVAIGSRGLVRQGAPLGRYVLSWGQVALRRLLLGLRVADTQCGFKAFRRAAALEVLSHLRVYDPRRLGPIARPSVTSGFDIEFLFVARLLGYRIAEVPVAWNYKDTRRVSLVRDAWKGTVDLVRISAAYRAGRYPKARRSEVVGGEPARVQEGERAG